MPGLLWQKKSSDSRQRKITMNAWIKYSGLLSGHSVAHLRHSITHLLLGGLSGLLSRLLSTLLLSGHAVTHLRHLDAVVQFDRFHILNYDRLFRRQNYALSFRALLYKFRFILLFLRLGATPCTKNRNNCNSSRISCKSVVEETR